MATNLKAELVKEQSVYNFDPPDREPWVQEIVSRLATDVFARNNVAARDAEMIFGRPIQSIMWDKADRKFYRSVQNRHPLVTSYLRWAAAVDLFAGLEARIKSALNNFGNSQARDFLANNLVLANGLPFRIHELAKQNDFEPFMLKYLSLFRTDDTVPYKKDAALKYAYPSDEYAQQMGWTDAADPKDTKKPSTKIEIKLENGWVLRHMTLAEEQGLLTLALSFPIYDILGAIAQGLGLFNPPDNASEEPIRGAFTSQVYGNATIPLTTPKDGRPWFNALKKRSSKSRALNVRYRYDSFEDALKRPNPYALFFPEIQEKFAEFKAAGGDYKEVWNPYFGAAETNQTFPEWTAARKSNLTRTIVDFDFKAKNLPTGRLSELQIYNALKANIDLAGAAEIYVSLRDSGIMKILHQRVANLQLMYTEALIRGGSGKYGIQGLADMQSSVANTCGSGQMEVYYRNGQRVYNNTTFIDPQTGQRVLAPGIEAVCAPVGKAPTYVSSGLMNALKRGRKKRRSRKRKSRSRSASMHTRSVRSRSRSRRRSSRRKGRKSHSRAITGHGDQYEALRKRSRRRRKSHRSRSLVIHSKPYAWRSLSRRRRKSGRRKSRRSKY